MFATLWWLADYPHVIGISSELRKEKSLKRFFYNIPLLLVRDNEKQVHIYFDVCPHKKAPLGCKKDEIYCSYHWWRFEYSWEIKNIPSSPHLEKKLKCKLHTIPVEEKYGFIWIFPNGKTTHKIPKIDQVMNESWKHVYRKKIFHTSDDLLIENFMDSTHTPIVHDGIVRTNKSKTKQTISVTQKDDIITANFGETKENVWLGMNHFFWNKLKISHTDTFLLPNLIQVNYKINNVDRFQAFIWCNQSQNGKSQGFFRLSYNFWMLLNIVLKVILPFVAKKVIKQDFDITISQSENQKYFWEIPENHIDYDLLHNKVKILKQKIQENKDTSSDTSQNTLNIYI